MNPKKQVKFNIQLFSNINTKDRWIIYPNGVTQENNDDKIPPT